MFRDYNSRHDRARVGHAGSCSSCGASMMPAGAQEGGPEQVSNHPLIQAGLVMGIRFLLSLESPSFLKLVLLLPFSI